MRYAANTAFLAAIYSDTIQDYNGRYSNFVKGQIDYMLGNNPRGSSYMVGFGSTYSKNPHHAHAHLNGRPDYNGNNGWDLFNANTPSHNLLSGALVGGPGSINDFDYQDTIQDYIRNEVSLDYNAGLTGALAYLYSLGPSNLPAITLAVSPASVLENGTTNLVYTFSRSGATSSALTVNYTVGGTATLGTDYTGIAASPATKTVSFAAGSSTAIVTVDPTADSTVEPNETVALTLATGTGYTVGNPGAVTGTITNDDVAAATLAIAATNANQSEGNSGTKAFTFTVTRSGNTSGANAVNWAVTGSGTNPANATDFAGGSLPSGTVSFAAGETSKLITVNVQGDTTVEANEAFTLSNPTNGATLTTTTATGTITNDDTPPTDDNLYFNVIINDPLNTYSAYHSLITTTLQASGGFWDDYIEGFDVDLDIIVNFNSRVLLLETTARITYLSRGQVPRSEHVLTRMELHLT